MDNPKVSVCIPCYNRQDFISDAIESVLAQTFTDFELIITDNCSTDNTLEVLKKYAAKDNRIKYYRNESNLGVCSNGNSSLLLAQGEYIKFLFSDDLLASNCLETFVNVMENHPTVSLATSFTKAIGSSDQIRDEKFFPGIGLLDGEKCQKNLLIEGNWAGSPSSVMFRRKDLHIGIGNHMWRYWLGDMDLWIRLLGTGNAYVVPEILSFLRIHDNQESTVQAVDFRLIRERLMLAKVAFWFPHMYGDYTRAERKAIHKHLLKRLVREGIGTKGLNPKIDMMKIGLSCLSPSRTNFCLILFKNLNRLFRKSRYKE